MSEFNKDGQTPLLFRNQSPMNENLLWSSNFLRQSPLTMQMLSQINFLANNINLDQSINLDSPAFEQGRNDFTKYGNLDKPRDRKFSSKLMSPSECSPNPMPLLTSSYMANLQNSQLNHAQNGPFLSSSRFGQSPFRAPLGLKSPSLLTPKVLAPRVVATDSIARLSNEKEGSPRSVSQCQLKAESSFEQKSEGQKDHKIPLPAVDGDGIIYVSAKRYKRILIRRKKRKNEPKLIPKPNKKRVRREPIHESRSLLAQRRERDSNGRYILIRSEEDKQNKVKCTRGRKSRKYYELMKKYEEEGNQEMIDHLKVNGTKAMKD